jgi:excisionase family DNA binding protein
MTGVLLVTEAAYYLRTTEDAMYVLVREQAIPFHKQGRRHLCVRRGDRSRACGMTEGQGA